MISPALLIALAALLAYLIGGLPFGYLFVRYTLGKDVRTMGSGNIGATNVHRSVGGKAGFIVLLLDIAKGLLAVWIGGLLTGNSPAGLACAAAAVMLGHCYPVFLQFRGGKAVACFVGAFLYLAPAALAVVTVVFVLVVAGSKYISLGSIAGAVVFPIALWATNRPPQPILAAAIFASALIIYRHRANISRLLQGKESVFTLKSGKGTASRV